ncbi:MAG: DHHA1 domain-containing protein [Thermoproteota archaeon]
MSERAAHTAEHIFVGALSKFIPGLRVRKVEVGEINAVTLEIESLDWDTVLKAEIVVNEIIAEAKPIKIHMFKNLKEAEEKFKKLRSREDRIVEDVRVVEVDGFDYAACMGEHVSNTAECSFFLVSKLSESGGKVKVEFLVGEMARRRALELCSLCFKVAKVLSTKVDDLEKAAERLKLECYTLRGRLMDTTDEVFRRLQPVDLPSFKMYVTCFRGVDEKIVMERAGQIVERDKRAVTLFAIKKKGSSFFILARGKELPFDCRKILEDTLRDKGFKGGGRPNFANGIVQSEECEEQIRAITESLKMGT